MVRVEEIVGNCWTLHFQQASHVLHMTVITQSFSGHLSDLDLAAISIASTVIIAITFGFLVLPFPFSSFLIFHFHHDNYYLSQKLTLPLTIILQKSSNCRDEFNHLTIILTSDDHFDVVGYGECS